MDRKTSTLFNQFKKIAITIAVIILAIAAFVFFLYACISVTRDAEPTDAVSDPVSDAILQTDESTSIPIDTTPEPTVTPTITETPAPTPEPTPSPTPEPTPSPTPTPIPYDFINGNGEPVYDYEFGLPTPRSDAVDDDYFNDAAFVGNSLSVGFMLYSGITSGDHYAEISVSLNNLFSIPFRPGTQSETTLATALANKQYRKIYVLLGINEIAMSPTQFRERYAEIVDRIQEAQPGADIYLQSVTPVTTTAAEGRGEWFNNVKIRMINDEIMSLCREKEVFYIDVYSMLANSEGDLPDASSFDGIHLHAVHYREWLEYLQTHTLLQVKKDS